MLSLKIRRKICYVMLIAFAIIMTSTIPLKDIQDFRDLRGGQGCACRLLL